MNSIRTETIAFDANIYVLGIRRSKQAPVCVELLFKQMPNLHVHLLRQVITELHRNLFQAEIDAIRKMLTTQATVIIKLVD